ncbi:MAG: GTPase [Crocosphaera sp.]
MVEKSLSNLRNELDSVLLSLGITPSNKACKTINLAMVGATSVGKSLTINSLIGHEVCSVGHVGNTTRKAGWNPIYLTESVQPDFNLLDLPGWGVSQRVDAEYRVILEKELPAADAVLWIIRADALGTLAYDLEWISKIVVPAVKNGRNNLVIGLNQVENVFDYQFQTIGQLSPTQLDIINKKCQLVHEEVEACIGKVDTWQIQPYSASMKYRLWNLLHSLVSVAGEYGWILQLITALKQEEAS